MASRLLTADALASSPRDRLPLTFEQCFRQPEPGERTVDDAPPEMVARWAARVEGVKRPTGLRRAATSITELKAPTRRLFRRIDTQRRHDRERRDHLRPVSGRAPRQASNTRGRGSRRQSASRGSPRGSPDDGESEPPGLEPALQEADSGKRLHSVSAVAPTATAERIAVVLADAGNDRWGLPKGSTYRELAQLVYGTEEPTRAQLSAARRAGARLLRSGQASKSRRGTAGVELRRLETAEDRELRAAAMRPIVERQEARRRATPYAIDTGSEIVEVPIEPVLMITPTGVELRGLESEPTQNESRPLAHFEARS